MPLPAIYLGTEDSCLNEWVQAIGFRKTHLIISILIGYEKKHKCCGWLDSKVCRRDVAFVEKSRRRYRLVRSICLYLFLVLYSKYTQHEAAECACAAF